MSFKKLLPSVFLGWLLLLTSPVFAAFDSTLNMDHIKSFHAKMTVSPQGETTIEETIVLFVGDHAAPHSDKVQKGFIRDLPLRGLMPGYDSIFVTAVSCDEVPVIATVQKSASTAAIKIQSEQPLQRNKQYTYHLTYRYPGLIKFSDQGGKELTIDWQFTLKYGLPTLKSVAEIFLPQESHTAHYHLKADIGNNVVQNFYPKNESDGASSKSFSLEMASRHIKAERGSQFFRAEVVNDAPSDLPVGLELSFQAPAVSQSLLEQYHNNKRVHASPSAFLFATGACLLLSYFFIAQALQQRQKEYQKKYQELVSQHVLQDMPLWQRHYVQHGSIDMRFFETFFYDLYQQGKITISKNERNELTLMLTPEQRQRLSDDEYKVMRCFFKDDAHKAYQTWEQSLHSSSDFNYVDLHQIFHGLLSNLKYPRVESAWLWAAIAATIVGVLFISKDLLEFFTKNSSLLVITLYCTSPLLLFRYVTDNDFSPKENLPANISATGNAILLAFLGVISYLHYLGYYNQLYVCLGTALYILWLFEIFLIVQTAAPARVAMLKAIRLLPESPLKLAQWQEIWAPFEALLKHFRDQAPYIYLSSGQRVYVGHRNYHGAAGYRGSSTTSSSVGGGGGGARGC